MSMYFGRKVVFIEHLENCSVQGIETFIDEMVYFILICVFDDLFVKCPVYKKRKIDRN